jgi:hypothetical protein
VADQGGGPDRARIAARLHKIRARLIQDNLGVPDNTARNIADRWGQFDFECHERRQNMRVTRQKVKDIIMGPGTEEDKNLRVAPAMAQFALMQKQQKEAKQKFEEDIQRMLTPVQQGRFVILMDDFQRRLTEALPDRPQDR